MILDFFLCSNWVSEISPKVNIERTRDSTSNLFGEADAIEEELSAENQPGNQTRNEEVWWILARLKLHLSRLQDRLFERNVISSKSTSMKKVREKIENSHSSAAQTDKTKRTPTELFTTSSLGSSSPTQPAVQQENFSEEHQQDWNIIAEICRSLEDVINQGKEHSKKSPITKRDRLVEYSYRAGSYIVQMILSEVRSIGEIISSIENLISQFRNEVARQDPQGQFTMPETSPRAFKDLILQESEILSALAGLSSNKVSTVKPAQKVRPCAKF